MKVGVHFSPRRVTVTRVLPDLQRTVFKHENADATTWVGQVESYARILEELTKSDGGQGIEAVTFDIGEILTLPVDAVVYVVRIAPRAPVAASHEPLIDYGNVTVRVANVPGGFNAKGQALTELGEQQLREAAQRIPQGASVVVCAMGALVNAEHETRAGNLLHTLVKPRQVSYSHSFYSDDVVAREYTAVVNSVLQAEAESLAVELTRATLMWLPHARLYVTTNEGGCIPLARLSATPIHMKFSHVAAMSVGAAELLNVTDGRFTITTNEGQVAVERMEGMFSVVPYKLGVAGVRIATSCVHASLSIHGARGEEANVPNLNLGVETGDISVDEVASLGAALAPLSAISTRTISLAAGITASQAINDLEAVVRARVIAFGAHPESVRVVEARSIPSTYSTSEIVSIRVRAVETLEGGLG